MHRGQQNVTRAHGKLPPFDIILCRDDPDGEIVFVLGSESIKHTVQELFPELLLDKHQLGWVGSVSREWAVELAAKATQVGLRVAFGERKGGRLVLQSVELVSLAGSKFVLTLGWMWWTAKAGP